MTTKEIFLLLLSNLDSLSYEDEIFLRGYLEAIYPDIQPSQSFDCCSSPFLLELAKRLGNED